MAKVILSTPITTDRYGLHFDKGEAHTDNVYLINKLIRKGVKVEIQEEQPEKPKEKTIDEMTVAELKKYADEKNIEIPSDITKKNEIIEFIKNYKEDEKPDNTETKPDNNSEGVEEETDDDEGEKNPEEETEPKTE